MNFNNSSSIRLAWTRAHASCAQVLRTSIEFEFELQEEYLLELEQTFCMSNRARIRRYSSSTRLNYKTRGGFLWSVDRWRREANDRKACDRDTCHHCICATDFTISWEATITRLEKLSFRCYRSMITVPNTSKFFLKVKGLCSLRIGSVGFEPHLLGNKFKDGVKLFF